MRRKYAPYVFAVIVGVVIGLAIEYWSWPRYWSFRVGSAVVVSRAEHARLTGAEIRFYCAGNKSR